MKNIILFSDRLNILLDTIIFEFTKLGKLTSILFKRRRKLEKIKIDYYKNWHFDEAYLVINFKFDNAAWYKIEDIKGTNFSKPVILNLKNIKSDSIALEVFGFFQKEDYKIYLQKEAKLNTNNLVTSLNNLNSIKITKHITITHTPKINLFPNTLELSFDNISMTRKRVHIKHDPYKKQDYL